MCLMNFGNDRTEWICKDFVHGERFLNALSQHSSGETEESTAKFSVRKRDSTPAIGSWYLLNKNKKFYHYTKLFVCGSGCYLRSLGLWRWYINTTIKIPVIVHCPVFYLKHDVSCRCLKQRNVNKIYRFVRTSQETHYVSITSPTG
jgi:hypothetical protein